VIHSAKIILKMIIYLVSEPFQLNILRCMQSVKKLNYAHGGEEGDYLPALGPEKSYWLAI